MSAASSAGRSTREVTSVLEAASWIDGIDDTVRHALAERQPRAGRHDHAIDTDDLRDVLPLLRRSSGA